MVTEFTETEPLLAAFDAANAKGDKFIVWLTGEINPETNESWCPDCVEAKPAITRIVDAGARPVLKGIVSRGEWRGNAEHPYKRHPAIKAAGVPSLILFEGGMELHRVDDLANFAQEDLMDMFNED